MVRGARRGRPVDPLVKAREEKIFQALTTPTTSRGISDALEISVPAVRLSLKRLRAEGTVILNKVDGAFVWSRAAAK